MKPPVTGAWAVVTGASAGIGREFARQLANAGWNLVLVARDAERLHDLASGLAVEVRVLPADLSSPAGITQVLEQLASWGLAIDLLVNNAGMGLAGPLQAQEPERLTQLTLLNVLSVVQLTRGLLPRMIERNRGGVIQVASIAGHVPVPFMAAYGASKAFVLSFSAALAEELRPTQVRMLACCPGPVPTEFQQRAGYRLGGVQSASMLSAEQVAELSLRAYAAGRRVFIPGFMNQLQIFLQRFVPLSVATWVSGWVMRRSGRHLP